MVVLSPNHIGDILLGSGILACLESFQMFLMEWEDMLYLEVK